MKDESLTSKEKTDQGNMSLERKRRRKFLTEEEKYEREITILRNLNNSPEWVLNIKNKIEDSRRGEEDGFYRFYHESFKVYYLQELTEQIVRFLCYMGECEPDDLSPMFQEIVREGTNKEFTSDANNDWLGETRSIVEAYAHASHVFNMLVKHGTGKKEAPSGFIEQGWGTVLHIYQIR